MYVVCLGYVNHCDDILEHDLKHINEALEGSSPVFERCFSHNILCPVFGDLTAALSYTSYSPCPAPVFSEALCSRCNRFLVA